MVYKTRIIDWDGVKEYVNDNWKELHCLFDKVAADYFTAFLLMTRSTDGGIITWNAANIAHETIAAWAGCSRKPDYGSYFPESFDRCLCVNGGGQLTRKKDECLGAAEIMEIGEADGYQEILEQWIENGTSFCKAVTSRGTITTQTTFRSQAAQCFSVDWWIKPQNGGSCCGQGPNVPDTPDPPPPDPIIETEDCKWYAQQVDAAIQDGIWEWKKYFVYPSDPSCGPAECYWESENGPIWDPTCTAGPPFGTGGDGGGCDPPLPAITYIQNVGCTYNPETNDYDETYEWKIDANNSGIKGLAKRVDTLATMMNIYHLIPYRRCADNKPQLALHWRSLRFESETKTPAGTRRVDKLLRYRGELPGNVDEIAAHWADFEWETGPVIVWHKGSPVGTPKVWAASEAEGKRVLRHAFAEAGFDADQVGEWGVSGSDHPRYGLRATVKLKCVDGCWSATARRGSDGYPIASIAQSDS